jgi:hypothetical protein
MAVVGFAAGVAGCGGSGVIPSDRRSASSWFALSVGVADGPETTAPGLLGAGATEQAVTSAATASRTRADGRRVGATATDRVWSTAGV